MVRNLFIIFMLSLLGCASIGKNENTMQEAAGNELLFDVAEIEKLTGGHVIAFDGKAYYPVDSPIKRLVAFVYKGGDNKMSKIQMREVDIRIVNKKIEEIALVDKNESDSKNYKMMRPVPVKATISGGGYTVGSGGGSGGSSSGGGTTSDGYNKECFGECLVQCMLHFDISGDYFIEECFDPCVNYFCRTPDPAPIPTRQAS